MAYSKQRTVRISGLYDINWNKNDQFTGSLQISGYSLTEQEMASPVFLGIGEGVDRYRCSPLMYLADGSDRRTFGYPYLDFLLERGVVGLDIFTVENPDSLIARNRASWSESDDGYCVVWPANNLDEAYEIYESLTKGS